MTWITELLLSNLDISSFSSSEWTTQSSIHRHRWCGRLPQPEIQGHSHTSKLWLWGISWILNIGLFNLRLYVFHIVFVKIMNKSLAFSKNLTFLPKDRYDYDRKSEIASAPLMTFHSAELRTVYFVHHSYFAYGSLFDVLNPGWKQTGCGALHEEEGERKERKEERWKTKGWFSG